jgi:hypothetical protein
LYIRSIEFNDAHVSCATKRSALFGASLMSAEQRPGSKTGPVSAALVPAPASPAVDALHVLNTEREREREREREK